MKLRRISRGLGEIQREGHMKVPARFYLPTGELERLAEEQALEQLRNVAHLPGIVKYALAMPDIHWGYGFPIGGVAAVDAEHGAVSPGGVGYDINCGVRLMATDLEARQARGRIEAIVGELFRAVPAGVGSSHALPRLDDRELDRVLEKGARWSVELGLTAGGDDLERCEESGCLAGADPDAVSATAKQRGRDQVGTLGSGNHFLEVQEVVEVYDEPVARAFGLEQGQLTVMIHSGSRGLGYQVCDDALAAMHTSRRRDRLPLPDPQLVAVPLAAPESGRYLAAMRAAANFAWANRQVMMSLIERAMVRVVGGGRRSIGFRLVYDVAHNIAKLEEHDVGGRRRSLLVHRKGATRAFPAGHPEVPEAYRDVGQPVLIPGDMGRPSFVCVGTRTAMEQTFGSAAHGAGRRMSRHAARRAGAGRNVSSELEERGVLVAARSPKTLAEEMPEAYKDAAEIVEALRLSGIALPVARLRPLGVIKG